MLIFIIPTVWRKAKPAACSRCLRSSDGGTTAVSSQKKLGTGRSPSLQRFIRANPAFLGARDKIKKLPRWCAKFGRSGLLQRLRNIQSAQIKHFERCFDFITILRA